MQRFEHCNVKTCVDELLALGNNNMKMWNIFQWLSKHNDLQHGTQAEIIKLYVNDEFVGYSLFENYQGRTDKITHYQGSSFPDAVYQELGVVHFITLENHRNKGYATQLANAMVTEVLAPLLAEHTSRNSEVHYFVTATGRAAPLMERTTLPVSQLIKQFYSEASFETKVVDYLLSLQK